MFDSNLKSPMVEDVRNDTHDNVIIFIYLIREQCKARLHRKK